MISKIYCHPILLLILTCSFLFSCSNSSTEDSQNQPTESEANSETVTVDETENKSGECPEKPGKLNSSNVEKVNLDQSETTVSGQLIAGEALGYSFEGKENQKLTYSTEDEFCMWIYTPDNDILEGLELPKNGSYTVQISIPKGAKTFELSMQLRSLDSSSASNNSGQSGNTSFDNIQTNNTNSSQNNIQTNNNTNSSRSNVPSINPQEAVNLIQNWQQAKRELFAPPYNRYLGEQLLTGKAYADNIRKPDGSGSSVDWLENNGAYYTYQLQAIDEVTNFNDFGGSAFIDVVTKEKRTLCINGRASRDDNTTYDKRLVRYNLQYVKGQWKIASYETQRVIDQGYNSNKSCQIGR
ncbi:MAG: DUF4101 domain-containing protein [Cyanobacteria bacterium]|jgi:hypothetical protein|nr:DUF4101 domain-containing protein [Cyanobacteria bacterium GSL.Bin21]